MPRLRLGLHWYAALWATLFLITLFIIGTPSFPVAAPSPSLAIFLSTLAAASGLAILYLGVLRYRVLHHSADIFTGLALGVLGLAHLLLWMYTPVMDGEPTGHRDVVVWLYLILFARAIATALFILAVLKIPRNSDPGGRLCFGIPAVFGTSAVIAIGTLVAIALGACFPSGAGPAARDLLATRSVIDDMLPDQRAWLLATNAVIATLMFGAAVRFAFRAVRLGDAHMHAVSLTMTLTAFGQIHAIFFPPIDPHYVSTGDAFRIAGYVLLLCMLVSRLGYEITDHVASEERIRISRELHDGLAQHLGLLHLRLVLAAAPHRDPQRRGQDLATARRLVEASLLEARQAVLSLRSGSVSWDQFQHTLSSFGQEFGQNHEVEVAMEFAGGGQSVDAGLQAEVLRILHEAFSNAVRHGEATIIAAHVHANSASLIVEVMDNGKGFSPNSLDGQGVGLASMHERIERRGGTLDLATAPGQGVTLRARLPLSRVRGAKI